MMKRPNRILLFTLIFISLTFLTSCGGRSVSIPLDHIPKEPSAPLSSNPAEATAPKEPSASSLLPPSKESRSKVSANAPVNGTQQITYAYIHIEMDGFRNEHTPVPVLVGGQWVLSNIQSLVCQDLETTQGCNRYNSCAAGTESVNCIEKPTIEELDQLPVLTSLTLDELWDTTLARSKTLRQLHTLILINSNLSDGSVLEQLIHLQELNVSYSALTDISFVKQMPLLRKLDISNCNLMQVEPISQLQHLEELDISGNPVDTIKPLYGLQKLRRVVMIGTGVKPAYIQVFKQKNPQIEVITEVPLPSLARTSVHYRSDPAGAVPIEYAQLAKMKNLKQLTIEEFQDATLDGFIPLKTLHTLGIDSAENLKNINALKHLPKLRSLDLGYIPISTLATIGQLSRLEKLRLLYSFDLSPLTKLRHLTDLSLGQTTGADISAIAKITSLESLSIGPGKDSPHDSALDVSPLASLTKLKSLDLSDNKLTGTYNLSTLTELETLILDETYVQNIDFVGELTHLQRFDFDSYDHGDLTPLTRLPNLRRLSLRNISQQDTHVLEQLTSLMHLIIHGGHFTDPSFLSKLTSLETLYLEYVTLNDLSFLTSLPGLKSITFSGCDITDAQLEQIKSLYNITDISLY